MSVVRKCFIAFDIVFCASASVSRKATSCCDESLPSVFVKIWDVFGHDVLPYKGTRETRIKAVSRTDRAHHIFHGRCLKVVAARWCADCNLPSACRADEVGTPLAYIPLIYIARVARSEHDVEVVCAATNNGALLEILQNDGQQGIEFVLMTAAEVEVVIHDGVCLCCLLQHLKDERSHPFTCRIVRAEEHHVATCHFGQSP